MLLPYTITSDKVAERNKSEILLPLPDIRLQP